ncbi:MAG: hypothetical protein KF729_02555, partial [Sandaracinaceae bacterium]|nr:hypothetical protein [Sandaracinaceae bacterium]
FRPPAGAPPSGSFRPPAGAPPSGSFRPPSGATQSGSFRPPVVTRAEPAAPAPSAPPSGSFRPPVVTRAERVSPGPRATQSGSFRPPVVARDPELSTPERRARPSEETRAAIRPDGDVPPTPPLDAPAVPKGAARALGLDSGSFRAPRITPAQPSPTPPKGPSTPAPHLSASGEAVTDYSASRAAGWRDADDDAVERSIQEHLAAGRKGAAARVARDAGQIGRALAWFSELGLHAQAGACLRQLGRPAEALTELLRVEPGSPGYRKACFDVVGLASELGKLGFDVDRFLTGFVAEGPADKDEVPTFLELAQLYVAGGFASGAKRCLRKVLELAPDHLEARELESKLRRERRARTSSAPRVVGAPASARGLPPLPPLEEYRALARAHLPRGD